MPQLGEFPFTEGSISVSQLGDGLRFVVGEVNNSLMMVERQIERILAGEDLNLDLDLDLDDVCDNGAETDHVITVGGLTTGGSITLVGTDEVDYEMESPQQNLEVRKDDETIYEFDASNDWHVFKRSLYLRRAVPGVVHIYMWDEGAIHWDGPFSIGGHSTDPGEGWWRVNWGDYVALELTETASAVSWNCNYSFRVNGGIKSSEGKAGIDGWIDDGTNFRATFEDGILVTLANSSAGGHS